MRISTMFFMTLLTLAVTVMNGCAPSPTPIATSEIPRPTLALPTATAIPPTPTSRATPQATATVPATVTPVPAELAEQLDALHMTMFLIQVDAELLGEAALRVQSGDLDNAGLGGVFTAIARYADTIDQVASGFAVPEGLSPAWDEAFEAHMETRAILSRWSNAEIDPEQVIAQVEPVRQSAEHAQQVAELWMMQLVGGDTVGLAAARAKQLARMVDQVFAPTPTPSPVSAPSPVSSTPRQGSIYFTSNRDGIEALYVMGADGSGLTRLTDDLGQYSSAALSPDGRHIAFVAERNGQRDIYMR